MAVKFTKLQNVDLDDTTGTEGEEEGDGGGRKEEGGKVRLIPEEQPNGEPMFNCESKRRWRWWWSVKHRIKRNRVGHCCWVNSWRTVLIAFVVFFATVVISLLVSKLAKEPTQEETFQLTQGEYTRAHTPVVKWKSGKSHSREDLVSCPAHTRLPVRNALVNKVQFLGLIPQKW